MALIRAKSFNEKSALIEERIVTDSTTARFDFVGLDISKHKRYRIEVDLPASSSFTMGIHVYINDDTTNANYEAEYIGNFGSGTNARPEILYIAQGGRGFSTTVLTLIDGYARYYTVGMGNISGSTNKDSIHYYGLKTATVTNITKLTIGSAIVTSYLPIGTRIAVYRDDV